MDFKLKALQGELGEVLEKIIRTKPLVLVEEEEKEKQLWLEPDYLYIQDLGLCIYSGIICLYYEETKDYEMDCSIYIFYSETGEEIYSEIGSDLSVCISNYFRCLGQEKTLDEIEKMDCTYFFDKGKFLEEKVISRKSFELEGEIDI